MYHFTMYNICVGVCTCICCYIHIHIHMIVCVESCFICIYCVYIYICFWYVFLVLNFKTSTRTQWIESEVRLKVGPERPPQVWRSTIFSNATDPGSVCRPGSSCPLISLCWLWRLKMGHRCAQRLGDFCIEVSIKTWGNNMKQWDLNGFWMDFEWILNGFSWIFMVSWGPGGSWVVIAILRSKWSKRLQKGDPNLLAQGFRKDGSRLPIADLTGQEFVHHDRGPPGPILLPILKHRKDEHG
jgi:hypothetical protein